MVEKLKTKINRAMVKRVGRMEKNIKETNGGIKIANNFEKTKIKLKKERKEKCWKII